MQHTPRSIADLPHFDACCPGWDSAGFPEDFAALFRDAGSSVLRYRESDVLVFRHRDLLAMAAQTHAGNTPHEVALSRAADESVQGEYDAMHTMLRNFVFASNPPTHKPKRRVFTQTLGPKSVAPMTMAAEQLAAEQLAEIADREVIDFVADFSLPFATRFWDLCWA